MRKALLAVGVVLSACGPPLVTLQVVNNLSFGVLVTATGQQAPIVGGFPNAEPYKFFEGDTVPQNQMRTSGVLVNLQPGFDLIVSLSATDGTNKPVAVFETGRKHPERPSTPGLLVATLNPAVKPTFLSRSDVTWSWVETDPQQ